MRTLSPAMFFAIALFALISVVQADSHPFFAIHVVDDATGHGVPLVRLQTTDKMRYYTDSNGYVAFNEPGLMNDEVWFDVSSHGYEFPAGAFGFRGVALKTTPGQTATLKIHRLNIAERLYRATGRGIYRDTILLGLAQPLKQGDINGKVMGCDTVQTALYHGTLFWLWGDTNKPSHPLGNYFTTGGTSQLPGAGGLDPALGVNFTYFLDAASGFVKPMARINRVGSENLPIWMDALMVLPDAQGKEHLVARFERTRDLTKVEQGLLEFNDATERFDEIKTFPLDTVLFPSWKPLRVNDQGEEYYYFAMPYPAVRVKNDYASALDLTAYEGFTCLKAGTRYTSANPPLDRGENGKLLWKWRKQTPALTVGQIEELIASGAIRPDEAHFRLMDVEHHRAVRPHGASVFWNEYKKKWVMIFVQEAGDSYLGEVWYAEAHSPEGPWRAARKIATHAAANNNQDFYNPMQHPYFAQEGGRLIYFEGTYTTTFSGTKVPTPLYDYNQLMYRLDLSDPRLKMPDAPPGWGDARPSVRGP